MIIRSTLLVLGTHGRTGLKKLLLGSVAEKLFRRAPCPVLTVGPEVVLEKPVAEFNHILFATDFSDQSLAAAPYAISLAQEHQSRLTLLHVMETARAGTGRLFEPDTQYLTRQLRELVSPEQDFWFEPEYVVEFGDAEEQILKAASDHKADLVVLGVRALTRLHCHGDPFWAQQSASHCGSCTLPGVDRSRIAGV